MQQHISYLKFSVSKTFFIKYRPIAITSIVQNIQLCCHRRQNTTSNLNERIAGEASYHRQSNKLLKTTYHRRSRYRYAEAGIE